MAQHIMPGWNRKGAVWTKRRGQQMAVVTWTKRGWMFSIVELGKPNRILATYPGQWKRSRQARKAANRALVSLPLSVPARNQIVA